MKNILTPMKELPGLINGVFTVYELRGLVGFVIASIESPPLILVGISRKR